MDFANDREKYEIAEFTLTHLNRKNVLVEKS